MSRRPPATRRDLCESVSQTGPLRVDRDKGVIYGVLLCGRESKNGHGSGAGKTVYTESAFADALSLYEGATAYAGHGNKRTPDAERHPADAVGVYRDVRLEGGQPRADLHYFRGKELAESIADDAERNLGAFKLSHNAQADGEVKDGVLTIESIYRVRSVDVVTRGATTRNLAESPEGAVPTTLRKVLESWAPKVKGAEKRKRLRDLLEEEPAASDLPLDAPMEAPPGIADAGEGESDPDEALEQGFEAACVAVIKADDMTADEKIAKLKELLKAQDKLLGEDGEGGGESESETPGESEPESKMESLELKKKLTRLERRERARELCAAEQVECSRDLLESLEGQDGDAGMLKLIRLVKAGPRGGRPRSGSPGARDLLEADYRPVRDVKDFAERLFS